MAVTGLILIAFLLVHMYGNLKMFVGYEAFDHYAEWLKGKSSDGGAATPSADSKMSGGADNKGGVEGSAKPEGGDQQGGSEGGDQQGGSEGGDHQGGSDSTATSQQGGSVQGDNHQGNGGGGQQGGSAKPDSGGEQGGGN